MDSQGPLLEGLSYVGGSSFSTSPIPLPRPFPPPSPLPPPAPLPPPSPIPPSALPRPPACVLTPSRLPPHSASLTSISNFSPCILGTRSPTPPPSFATSPARSLDLDGVSENTARGAAAKVTHFPPSLPHLPLLLSLLSPSPHPILLPPSSWALRYVLLAHLSLVALVPFELDKVGGRGTKDRLWAVGTRAVDEGRGKEAEAGSRLVAALMARCVYDLSLGHLSLSLSSLALSPALCSPPRPFSSEDAPFRSGQT